MPFLRKMSFHSVSALGSWDSKDEDSVRAESRREGITWGEVIHGKDGEQEGFKLNYSVAYS